MQTATVAATKIAVCYKPNSSDNVPSRYKHVITREKSGAYCVGEILDNAGTGFDKWFNTESEAFAYSASLGFTEVVPA